MPLFDFWCPECDDTFEAVVSRVDDNAECPSCYAAVPRGPRGAPPDAQVRLRAHARREGRDDAEGEERLAHFGEADSETLCDLDWEHQGSKTLRASYDELQRSAPLPPWEVLEPTLRAAYEAAFEAAAPDPDDDA